MKYGLQNVTIKSLVRRIVRTCGRTGLTESTAKRLIKLLGRA